MPLPSSEQPVSTEESLAADFAACRNLLIGGSRSFYAASLLLPRRYRDPATALYAFCRIADDAVDCVGEDTEAQLEALHKLRQRLDGIYSHNPAAESADRALSDVVHRLAVPRTLLDALLEGFEWDAAERQYETLSDVYAYSARVAGTVGAMMTALMGVRDADMVARACDLGVAMQLTNICRDVGEDARNGRIYLPRAWFREVGMNPDVWLENPVFNPQLAGIIKRLLNAADELYKRADVGISSLPLGCRPGIHAARYLYAEIGRQLERQGLDSISQRAVVPRWHKFRLMMPILGRLAVPARYIAADALPETQYLVDAVVHAGPQVGVAEETGAKGSGGLLRILEIIETLEHRDRAAEAHARQNLGQRGAASES